MPENGIPGEFKKDGKPKPYTKKEFARYCGVSSTTLHRFLQKKKLMGGAESPVYMPAYKFFEKKRIFEGKKKTQGRLNVELEYVSTLINVFYFVLFLFFQWALASTVLEAQSRRLYCRRLAISVPKH